MVVSDMARASALGEERTLRAIFERRKSPGGERVDSNNKDIQIPENINNCPGNIDRVIKVRIEKIYIDTMK